MSTNSKNKAAHTPAGHPPAPIPPAPIGGSGSTSSATVSPIPTWRFTNSGGKIVGRSSTGQVKTFDIPPLQDGAFYPSGGFIFMRDGSAITIRNEEGMSYNPVRYVATAVLQPNPTSNVNDLPPAAVYVSEQVLGIDLNHDGVIGNPAIATTVDTAGGTDHSGNTDVPMGTSHGGSSTEVPAETPHGGGVVPIGSSHGGGGTAVPTGTTPSGDTPGLDANGAYTSGNFIGFTPAQVEAFSAGVNASQGSSGGHGGDSGSGSGSGAGSGSGSGGGAPAPAPASPAPTAPAPAPPVNHFFTLIRGNGTSTGDPRELKDNGNAIYILNNRGERFHVTEALKNEMIAGGTWYDPEPMDQATVDSKALRYQVNSLKDVETINNATVGNNYMLIKGNSPDTVDNNTLIGNANAVYAVNDKGEKVHVTEAAYNQLGQPPVGVISQSAADFSTVHGALISSGGALTTTTDAGQDHALASVLVVAGLGDPTPNPNANPVMAAAVASAAAVLDPPASTPDPAPVAAPASEPEVKMDEALMVSNSNESVKDFKIIRGADGDMTKGDTDLVGNGRAVWVVNSAGQKFHVTGQLADQMRANGAWKEPDTATYTQAQINNMPTGSSVSLTNMDQLRTIDIASGSEFRLVKGTGHDIADDSTLEGNSRAVYALTASGDRYHVTNDLANKMGGAFGHIDELSQDEVDHLGTMKGSLSTVKDLNQAVKGSASSFADHNSMPGGAPPMPGYSYGK